MKDTLLHEVALTFLPSVGDVLIKGLVSYCGGIKEVFDASHAKLQRAPGIGDIRAREIMKSNALDRAAQELKFIEKNQIEPLFYLDADYPKRLLHCHDSPVMLYYKGNADLNTMRIVGIVGTRTATDYGRHVTELIVEKLKGHNVLIASGMAYGIDIIAHREALKHGLPTVGVLGHGLDRLYPSQHKGTADKMYEQGGLLAEFPSGTMPDRENFPRRNRIVAGMSDATIVVETKIKGGSMITATLANSYDRDVFAVPGNITQPCSEGCNYLIRTNRAAILDSMDEFLETMRWTDKENTPAPPRQLQLLTDLTPDEKALIDLLQQHTQLAIDELTYRARMPASQVAAALLGLELNGIVRTLPGKAYALA
ncbi:DNA-processing protein DprA [soil metagenome]